MMQSTPNPYEDTQVGALAPDVPIELKQMLPDVTFILTKQLPGVYVIFFPHNGTVYVGHSANVTHEISMLRGGYRAQPAVNDAFQQSGYNAKAYAIAQGPGLKDVKLD